ncbi:hypothetical protein COO60DRAFT_1457310 [Scenedesmus sp. NREL 46B-D3]|nr:hypothetical protein COO60DRAFT_1457310 [Scenedesmus sp. NREL 46B-D3]
MESDAVVDELVDLSNDVPAPTPAPAASKSAAQHAQQWLGSITELVSYVESKAQLAGRQAQQAQYSSVDAQLEQLQAQLQQQTMQLHSQAQELNVLRALQPNSGNPNGSRAGQLYQELQRRQQEADGWRSRYQLQLQCRDVAESALQETLAVVDQLSNDFEAVSGMLKNLQLLESASAAAAAAESGGSTSKNAAAWWLGAEAGMALLLVATLLQPQPQQQLPLPSPRPVSSVCVGSPFCTGQSRRAVHCTLTRPGALKQLQASGSASAVGTKKPAGRFVDHTLLMSQGPLQSVSLYFGSQERCLRGAKAVFARPAGPSLAGMVGRAGGSRETVLRLAAGEVVTKVEYKANTCVGKVVTLGPSSNSHPDGAKYVGYPCLEVTSNDSALDPDGTSSERGYYVAKLCEGNVTQVVMTSFKVTPVTVEQLAEIAGPGEAAVAWQERLQATLSNAAANATGMPVEQIQTKISSVLTLRLNDGRRQTGGVCGSRINLNLYLPAGNQCNAAYPCTERLSYTVVLHRCCFAGLGLAQAGAPQVVDLLTASTATAAAGTPLISSAGLLQEILVATTSAAAAAAASGGGSSSDGDDRESRNSVVVGVAVAAALAVVSVSAAAAVIVVVKQRARAAAARPTPVKVSQRGNNSVTCGSRPQHNVDLIRCYK